VRFFASVFGLAFFQRMMFLLWCFCFFNLVVLPWFCSSGVFALVFVLWFFALVFWFWCFFSVFVLVRYFCFFPVSLLWRFCCGIFAPYGNFFSDFT